MGSVYTGLMEVCLVLLLWMFSYFLSCPEVESSLVEVVAVVKVGRCHR